MKITTTTGSLLSQKNNVLALGVFQEPKLEGSLKQLDSALGGAVKHALKRKAFTGSKNELHSLDAKSLKATHVVLVGLGKKEEYTLDIARQAAAVVLLATQGLKHSAFTLDVFPVPKDENLDRTVEAITEGALLASYSFDAHKTKDKKNPEVKVTSFSLVSKDAKTTGKASSIGAAIAHSTNFTRMINDEPANIATPEFLAQHARSLKKFGIRVQVLGEKEIRKEKMNAFLSVNKGSDLPPRFLILDYKPKNYKKTLAVVGKGITFDTGGISLKPSKAMHEMKYDKSGACSVLGIVRTAALLKLPHRVVGLAACTENMPGGHATLPGDIVKSRSGKTIEILNTDAEGRMVLADALDYSKKFKPDAIIDLATLTGACVVALGKHASGILGTDEKLIADIRTSGERSGERVWQLPLWPEHEEMMKSEVADLKNISETGEAGTTTAAAFLKAFVPEKVPWAHLDIAATAWPSSPGGLKPYVGKGASGVGVRLVIDFLRHWK